MSYNVAEKAGEFGFNAGPSIVETVDLAGKVNNFLLSFPSPKANEVAKIWLAAGEIGKCPTWMDLELYRHPELQANSYLLDYSEAEGIYRARFVGQEIVDRTGEDMTGKAHADMAEGALLDQWIAVSEHCRLEKAVCSVAFDWSFIDKAYIKVWNVLFPLTRDGKVNQICGFYIWTGS